MTDHPRDAHPIVHPAIAAEAERLDHAIKEAELKLRQTFSRTAAFAFGAWMAMDGVLFIMSGPARLTSPVFAYASELIPAWPWPFAVFISVAGVLLMWASLAWLPLLGGIAYMAISAWHLAYGLMVWRAIALPPPPGTRPVSYTPIADHGALSAIAFITGLLLLRIWHRQRHSFPPQAAMRE